MNEKWFLQSKRFWGMFITTATVVAPALGPFIGWNISPAIVVEFGDAVTTAITSVGAVVGLFLTFYGSMKAEGPMVIKTS